MLTGKGKVRFALLLVSFLCLSMMFVLGWSYLRYQGDSSSSEKKDARSEGIPRLLSLEAESSALMPEQYLEVNSGDFLRYEKERSELLREGVSLTRDVYSGEIIEPSSELPKAWYDVERPRLLLADNLKGTPTHFSGLAKGASLDEIDRDAGMTFEYLRSEKERVEMNLSSERLEFFIRREF